MKGKQMPTLLEMVEELRERVEKLEAAMWPPEFKPKSRSARSGEFDPYSRMDTPQMAKEMAAAVGDGELNAIVRDLAKPPMLKSVAGEAPKGRGWVEPVRDREPLNIDAMVEHMVGGPNDTSKLK
jgi:hypothetical protein